MAGYLGLIELLLTAEFVTTPLKIFKAPPIICSRHTFEKKNLLKQIRVGIFLMNPLLLADDSHDITTHIY